MRSTPRAPVALASPRPRSGAATVDRPPPPPRPPRLCSRRRSLTLPSCRLRVKRAGGSTATAGPRGAMRRLRGHHPSTRLAARLPPPPPPPPPASARPLPPRAVACADRHGATDVAAPAVAAAGRGGRRAAPADRPLGGRVAAGAGGRGRRCGRPVGVWRRRG